MMNLTRLRRSEFQNEVLLIMDGYEKIISGDQDIINIYLHYHPCKFYFLMLRNVNRPMKNVWIFQSFSVAVYLSRLWFGFFLVYSLLLGHVYELTCAFNYGFEHCLCIYGGYCRCSIADASGFSILHGRAHTFTNTNAIDRTLFSIDIYDEFLKVRSITLPTISL